jgi:hypothetical protein
MYSIMVKGMHYNEPPYYWRIFPAILNKSNVESCDKKKPLNVGIDINGFLNSFLYTSDFVQKCFFRNYKLYNIGLSLP